MWYFLGLAMLVSTHPRRHGPTSNDWRPKLTREKGGALVSPDPNQHGQRSPIWMKRCPRNLDTLTLPPAFWILQTLMCFISLQALHQSLNLQHIQHRKYSHCNYWSYFQNYFVSKRERRPKHAYWGSTAFCVCFWILTCLKKQTLSSSCKINLSTHTCSRWENACFLGSVCPVSHGASHQKRDSSTAVNHCACVQTQVISGATNTPPIELNYI